MVDEGVQSKLMATFRKLSIGKKKTPQEEMEEAAYAAMANFGRTPQMIVNPRAWAQLKDLFGGK